MLKGNTYNLYAAINWKKFLTIREISDKNALLN